MYQIRAISAILVLLLLLIAVACSSSTPVEPSAGSEISEVIDEDSEGSEEVSEDSDEVSEAGEEVDFEDLEEFNRSDFTDPTNIDNQWLPMQPGTRWVFEGFTVDDGEEIDHRIEFTVTDLTKMIDGIPTVVAYIEDYSDDELVEAEIAFYAQDNSGNVWYLGEHPEEFEDGEFVDAPTWIAGMEGAQAGIKMKAQPRLGTDSYSQGWAPSVEWTDRGQVYKMGQQICVPANCYGDVLVIDEFNQEEPGAFQLKYYARNVGNVQVGWRGEDAQQEDLELVEREQLEPVELAAVRQAALDLEEHAYEISEDIYGRTEPSVAAESSTDEYDLEELDHSNFDDPTNIDNKWLPMQPGTQWTFEGITIENGELFNHLLIFTVTDLVKEIDGIPSVVAYIEDFSNGELVEAEIAFFAQDNDGNVWYLGEYPEEYKDGQFVGAPTWIAGKQDAQAGIKMPADPQLGMDSFSQGFAPVPQWSDRGQVYRMDEHTCVPFECFEDVMIMDEFNLEEPGSIQLKYYAPDIGQVRVGFRGNDVKPEMLEMVDLKELDANALTEVSAAALELEARAHKNHLDVFGETPLAESPKETN